jgi:hypothetical protein
LEQNFIDNLNESTAINENGVLAMTARLLMEVNMRSFLRWCFQEYGERAKFKHNNVIYHFSTVDDLGYVTGIDEEGKEIHLHPRLAISKLPTKAFRFFQEEWLSI